MNRLTVIACCLWPCFWAGAQVEHDGGPAAAPRIIWSHDEALPLNGNPAGNIRLPKTETLGDFTLSVVLELEREPGGAEPVPLLTLQGSNGALKLQAASDGGISCQYADKYWEGMPEAPRTGRKIHVALCALRDPRQALAGLWIDGIECTSLNLPVGNISIEEIQPGSPGKETPAKLSRVRLYDRALTRPEIMELALQTGGATAKRNLVAFDSRTEWMDGEVLAVLGGSEAVALVEDGAWEAGVMLAAAGKRLSVRNLAWETDTVHRRDRPMNFGGLAQQLERVSATAVLLMFGRQECLERGAAGLAGFRESLEEIMRTCEAHTPRLILAGPPPFEKKPPPERDLTPLNAALAEYSEAIREIAGRHHALFVDTLNLWPHPVQAEHWTTDGLTLSEQGAWELANCLWSLNSKEGETGHALLARAALAPLIAPVHEKNRMWHDYWRPSNWAFLYGDRTAQPSSRDHLNPSVRWFPQELENYNALIEAGDREIWKTAADMGGKLP